MAKLLEWDKFAMVYGENFSSTMGAKGVNARIVIGAIIIKHIEAKDDRGTIEAIKENPYMQFFLGLITSVQNQFLTRAFLYISENVWAMRILTKRTR
jgi:hypothetical protein